MKLIKKNTLFFILTLIIMISFIFIGWDINIQAEEISLPDAIDWGLEHNSSIQEIKDEIKTIERNLA